MRRKANVILAVIYLATFGAGCSSLSSSPSNTVRKLWELAAKNDAERMMKLYSKRALHEGQGNGVSETKGKLTALQKLIKDQGGISSVEIRKEDVLADKAEVEANIKFGNGALITQEYYMVKEDGDWKINRITQ